MSLSLLYPKQYRDPWTYFALLVGIDAYSTLHPLANCVADVKAMRDMLLDSGYPASNVVTTLNCTHTDLRAHVSAFTRLLDGAEGCHVLFFYAGHGVDGAGGEPILMPVDADLSSDSGEATEAG